MGELESMSVKGGPDLRRYMDKKLALRLNAGRRVTGVLRGFDQFMNLVLDETIEEVSASERNEIGMVCPWQLGDDGGVPGANSRLYCCAPTLTRGGLGCRIVVGISCVGGNSALVHFGRRLMSSHWRQTSVDTKTEGSRCCVNMQRRTIIRLRGP